jgi:hypothetical protein
MAQTDILTAGFIDDVTVRFRDFRRSGLEM